MTMSNVMTGVLINALSEEMRKGKSVPAPDVFDENKLPYGIAPGNNKFGMQTCPSCGKHATETGQNKMPKAFLFRDKLSAKEYMISGLCQACQDSVFGANDSEELEDW